MNHLAKVALVTDSGANIPRELLEKYPIHTVPFNLIWGSKVYRDGVDIQPQEFYERLTHSKEMPTTSQPSPEAFRHLYTHLLEKGYEILSIHTSSLLTGTMDSAIQAVKTLAGAPIELVDSRTTAMEMGFHVLSAAQEAVKGAALSVCKTVAEKAREYSGIYFVVNTLDYLQRGGRIGSAAAFFGSAFKIKPILHLQAGRIEVVSKVRTTQKAIEKMMDIVEQKVGKNTPIKLSALYANEPERATSLLEQMSQRFLPGFVKEAFCAGVSPVIGTHTGPDGVGLAYTTGI